MRLSVRILAITLGLLVTFSIVSPRVHAQNVGTGTTENPYWMHSVQDVVNIFTKDPHATDALNKEFGDIGAGVNQQIGFVLSMVGACDLVCDANCPAAVSYQRSTMAGLSNIAVATYINPPASTYAFVDDIGRTLGFKPTAQAQGIGFSGLAVLLPMWKAFRNIAYALLAVILIVVGFMVMFRKKIDPKTVVTVQNAIPRIVVALLLVTFSYAIVGVLIDLMYLTIILAVSVLGTASGGSLGTGVSNGLTACVGVPGSLSDLDLTPGINTNPGLTTPEVTSLLLSGGVGKLLGFFFGSGFQAVGDLGNLITGGNKTLQTVATVVPPLFGFLTSGGSIKGALAGGLLSGPVLLTIIVLIVLLFGFIRLVFMLLDAYINIIISLLTAPFQLMMEAIPGTNSFNSWFRNLLSKLLAFPITVVFLVIAAILTSSDAAKSLWAPPLLASGGGTYGMAGFIGLGFLLVIPNVVAGLQKAMKAEAVVPGGPGVIFGPLGQGVGQIFSLLYQGSFVAGAFRHKPDSRGPVQVAREGAEKGFGGLTGGGSGGH